MTKDMPGKKEPPLRKELDPLWREVKLEAALPSASPAVRAILESALRDKQLGFEEGLALTSADGSYLLALVKTAADLRPPAVRHTTTHLANRNPNFTNLCILC